MERSRSEQATQRAAQILAKHLLGPADVGLLASSLSSGVDNRLERTQAERAAREVVEGRQPAIPDLEALLRVIESGLDEDIPELEGQRLQQRRFSTALKGTFAALIAALTSFFVAGGIATGHSSLTSHGLLGIMLLGLLISLLAVFEGLQISVTTLRLKDVSSLRGVFPRSAELHRSFRKEEGTRSFLAGRQLFVVIIVFFAARLTTFPTLTEIPWVGWPIPFRDSLFWHITLDYGVFGALFVLWSGQLMPQFLANKSPVVLLNAPGMGAALRLSYWVDRLGLTLPGHWLASWSKDEDSVPLSPQERFRESLEEVQGYATLSLKRFWSIKSGEATLKYENSIEFSRSGFSEILDDGLQFQASDFRVSFDYRLLSLAGGAQRDAGAGNARTVAITSREEQSLEGGWARVVQRVEPTVGSFKAGDVLVTNARVFSREARGDVVHVSVPTRILIFGVALDGAENLMCGDLRITRYRNEADLASSAGTTVGNVDFVLRNGYLVAEFIERYPAVGSVYVFEWSYEY